MTRRTRAGYEALATGEGAGVTVIVGALVGDVVGRRDGVEAGVRVDVAEVCPVAAGPVVLQEVSSRARPSSRRALTPATLAADQAWEVDRSGTRWEARSVSGRMSIITLAARTNSTMPITVTKPMPIQKAE